MPNACVSLWPTEECEWSSWDIWRSSDVIEHAIYFILALMLSYTSFALARFLFRCFLHRGELCDSSGGLGTDDIRNRRKLIAELSKGFGILKGISSAAPFLGLAGTSYGILCVLWFSYSGSPERYGALLFTRIAFAFTPTLAGIFVALPASTFHAFLRARIESFSGPSVSTEAATSSGRFCRFAETLPLKEQFSSLPAFGLLAAPALAVVIALFTPFHPYHIPVGLRVLQPQEHCDPGIVERTLVLRIAEGGELFLNTEQEDWKRLPARLVEIYKLRQDRVLYLLAEDGVPFQKVADAIDLTRNLFGTAPNSQNITVRLMTPQTQAENARCHTPIWGEPMVRLHR